MQTCGKRAGSDRRGGLQRNQALDLMIGHCGLASADGATGRREGRGCHRQCIVLFRRIRTAAHRRRSGGFGRRFHGRRGNDVERRLEGARVIARRAKRGRAAVHPRIGRPLSRKCRLDALGCTRRPRAGLGHRRARVFTLQAPLLPAVIDDDADHQQESGDDQSELQRAH